MTPTVALAIRINKITPGSTKAVAREEVLPSSLSSTKARIKETTAEPKSIRTSWSLNCSKISSSKGVGGSSGSSKVHKNPASEVKNIFLLSEGMTNHSIHRLQYAV